MAPCRHCSTQCPQPCSRPPPNHASTGDSWTLQEGLCHTQVCCTQSPCPCGSPLLTRTSSADSLCGVSGSWCMALFEPSERLWRVWGLILKRDFVPPTVLLGLLLCPWMRGISSKSLQCCADAAPVPQSCSSPTHQQKIGFQIYWAWPCPSEQDPVSPSISLSHQEASISLLLFSIRGHTDWKTQSQKTNQSDHMDHSLV